MPLMAYYSRMASSFDDAYVPDVVPDEDLEYFAKGNHGTRIGWGTTPAVLVVDVTEEFVSDEYASGRTDTGMRAVEATAEVLAAAREADHPVFYTTPSTSLPVGYRGTTKRPITEASRRERERGNHIHEAVAPAENDVVIEKPRASAFFDTHLGNMLHHHDVDTLVVTGLTTSGCVRATVVDAHSSNFRTIVPAAAVADRSDVSHEMSLFDIDMKYGDVTETAAVVEQLRALD